MNHKKIRIEAGLLTVVLVGAMFLAPARCFMKTGEKNLSAEQASLMSHTATSAEMDLPPYLLDRNYDVSTEPAPISKDDTNDDGGHKKDAGMGKAQRIH